MGIYTDMNILMRKFNSTQKALFIVNKLSPTLHILQSTDLINTYLFIILLPIPIILGVSTTQVDIKQKYIKRIYKLI